MLESLLTEVCGTSNVYHVEHMQSACRVDESHTLESLLTEVCGMSNVYHVEHMQSACTAESRDRFHAVPSDVEFWKAVFLLCGLKQA